MFSFFKLLTEEVIQCDQMNSRGKSLNVIAFLHMYMYIVMTTEHCFPGTLLHLTNLYSFFTGALRQKLVIPEQL